MKLKDIKKILTSSETTLKRAMRILEAASHRILFVVDDDNRLIGSVTDGDTRRSILSGFNFESPISEIMFKSPRSVRHDEENFKAKAEKFIIDEKLHAIPVLDEADRIIDILFWHDFLEKHPLEPARPELSTNPVVIMAGGKGRRLDPFTKILPKPLIPFGDKPIIEKIMDNFAKHGFRNFIVTLNYRKEIIKTYFKENQAPYNLEWVEEARYLGTAGSLELLKNKIKETFFVCNCDIFLDRDFKNILLWHKSEKALATLIGCHKEIVFPYGTLQITDGRLKAINEKPKFDTIINTGIYIMEPEVLSFISAKERLDMNKLIERIIKKGKVSVYPICDGWFDIGQWKEYRESLYLLQNGKNG